ncbi:hypothetical protein PUV54_00180 [Hyphococcus flavus]|uniref:Uncharacterized protein n=1 Tax=Hyphococcus flavus TaxID=1866326 RepID=A0AAE9ZDI2_9PROT|nr:hypothetical protein [Hyphococcus flavus]WDI31610.1 hypothetical protein PUV54_00180 [Hyphococcus flavus]
MKMLLIFVQIICALFAAAALLCFLMLFWIGDIVGAAPPIISFFGFCTAAAMARKRELERHEH